jgi:hypothetical protein
MASLGDGCKAAFLERDEWGTWQDMVRSLEQRGVTVCTAAERKVLEAMAAIHIDNVNAYRHESNERLPERPAMMAELARRGGTGG